MPGRLSAVVAALVMSGGLAVGVAACSPGDPTGAPADPSATASSSPASSSPASSSPASSSPLSPTSFSTASSTSASAAPPETVEQVRGHLQALSASTDHGLSGFAMDGHRLEVYWVGTPPARVVQYAQAQTLPVDLHPARYTQQQLRDALTTLHQRWEQAHPGGLDGYTIVGVAMPPPYDGVDVTLGTAAPSDRTPPPMSAATRADLAHAIQTLSPVDVQHLTLGVRGVAAG